MDVIQALQTASGQLRELFKDKSSLNGFRDWDLFIGSVLLIEQAAEYLQTPQEQETTAEGE